jgi:diguanylate cyclase (GGDEF)-like protein
VLAGAAQTNTLRAVNRDVPGQHLRSLIAGIRFNEEELSFENGLTIGPDAGELKILLAPPEAGAGNRPLYRLLGFDNEWREAGQERGVLYTHLAPGHYEFDIQATESGVPGAVIQSIPITVIAPFWQTGAFRTLIVIDLLLLVYVLYKMRVGSLINRNKKLQETVSQTKAELTLAAKIAGDAQVALKEQALKDSLTGLWNRRAIFSMLEKEVCRAQRDRLSMTMVMIDLDHFKNINDTHGHLTGDDVLREVAGRLVELMRPYDFAGRYGGEEFLIVLPGCSPQNGMQRAETFRRAVADSPVPTAMGPLAVTCSLGVAAFDEAMSPEDLIHRADEALYRAKRRGRNIACGDQQQPVAQPRRA